MTYGVFTKKTYLYIPNIGDIILYSMYQWFNIKSASSNIWCDRV